MNKIIHDFDGACRPGGPGEYSSQETFSVGVFQLLPKCNGKGTKRGPVKVRIQGFRKNPHAVYEKAREIVDALDAGNYAGPKAIKVY